MSDEKEDSRDGSSSRDSYESNVGKSPPRNSKRKRKDKGGMAKKVSKIKNI